MPGGLVSPGKPGYKYFLEITPEMEALVRRAEQEHIDDFDIIFQRVFVAAANVINRLAGQAEGFPGATSDEARSATYLALHEALPQELIRVPLDRYSYLDFVGAVLDRARFLRDGRGLHRMGVEIHAVSEEHRAYKVRPVPIATTSIGEVSSEFIATWAITTASFS